MRLRWSTILLAAVEPTITNVLHGFSAAQKLRLIEVSTVRASINAVRYEPDMIIAAEVMADGVYGRLLNHLRSRESPTPVIVASRILTQERKVEIFEAGASDCIDASMGDGEVLARIRRTLRRSSTFRTLPATFQLDGLHVDLDRRRVEVAGKEVAITAKEYDLLEIFILHADRVVSTDFICSRLWTIDTDAQIVRYYVKKLRDKLGDALGGREVISNVPGVGYRLSNIAGTS